MGSLQELLSKEGFEGYNFLKGSKKVKFRDRAGTIDDHSVTLPIYICHDRKSFDFSKPKPEKALAKSGSSVYSLKTEKSRRSDEPAIDEIATKAVISILSGYVAQYLKDKSFRDMIRDKCHSCCLVRRNKDSDNGVFANMELGIESVERLVENPGTSKELKMKALGNSIGFLTIVASLNSKGSRNGSTCGIPNSHLSACAQLYLSIVYKLDKNDRISARHMLQVFCDAPYLARTHLLPELWEHFFLPHLLHLKIWYGQQVDILSESNSRNREEKMTTLNKVYADQMDMGTVEFAIYYKQWLKTGAQAPTLPSVPLPSTTLYAPPRRRSSSSDSLDTNSTINNKLLYKAVFGPVQERQESEQLDLESGSGSVIDTGGFDEEERIRSNDYSSKRAGNTESKAVIHRRSVSLISCGDHKSDTRKPDYMRFFPCRNEETEYSIQKNVSVKKIVTPRVVPSSDLSRAVAIITDSDSLSDCEMAIRVMTKAWLDSQGDPTVEKTLLKSSVIEGMLEILFVSNDDEILELVISFLTEFVTRNELNGKIVLNSDPQLEAFRELMRSSNVFLKAAALLHLVKPQAKQMISPEWVPLVLRVLEFGDQLQTLFTVRCIPQVAAYYFLDELLKGFDEDKNRENARQVVSLGGLNLLVRRMESGDITEKSKAASVLYCCIKADGRCRHYLASNLNADSILALLVLGKHIDSDGIASTLLAELLCLQRVTQRIKFLNGLTMGWGSLNTMHILLLYLQRAPPEQRPTVAAIMLQLDLMGDPLKSSVYREEAIEAILAALDCQTCNEKIQQQSAKALLMLAGRFSYLGEPETEKWILREAGFDEGLEDSFHGRDIVVNGYKHLNQEDEEAENWQRKVAFVLFRSGNKKLVAALGEAIANGIPGLASASLVTVAWMSSFMHSIGDESLESMICSALLPHLLESLNYDKAVEERVLASFSLLGLAQSSNYISKVSEEEKALLLLHLRNLSRVTWTASKLVTIITGSPRHRYPPDKNI